MQRPLKTFVGPLSYKPGANRTMTPYFQLLQTGSGMLELAYPDKQSAKEARKQLLKAGGAHAVHMNSTLKAIWEALLTPEDAGSLETGSGDENPDK